MTMKHLNLINTNIFHTLQIAVGETVTHHILHRAKHAVPTGSKHLGGLFPTQTSCPAGQEYLIGSGHPLLPHRPGNPLHPDSIFRTGYSPWNITEKHRKSPKRHILIQSSRLSVIHCPPSSTLGTLGSTIRPRSNGYHYRFGSLHCFPLCFVENKRLVLFNLIEYRFNQHCLSLVLVRCLSQTSSYQTDWGNATFFRIEGLEINLNPSYLKVCLFACQGQASRPKGRALTGIPSYSIVDIL